MRAKPPLEPLKLLEPLEPLKLLEPLELLELRHTAVETKQKETKT